MKLKYLLPVATIASVATIVTPLVTSCGEKWDAEYNIAVKSEDFAKSLKTQPIKKDQITGDYTDFYFNAIEKDHQIVLDDTAYAINMGLYSPSADKIDSFILKANFTKLDKSKKTVNAHVYYKVVYKDLEGDGIEENDFVYTNMKMEVSKSYTRTMGYYGFIPSFHLQADDDKKISLIKDSQSKISGKCTETYKYSGHEEVTTYSYDLNHSETSVKEIGTWTTLYNYACILSYYLSELNA